MRFVMFEASNEEGLKAQVGISGLKKRTGKKGWRFVYFTPEGGTANVTDSETIRSLLAKIEGQVIKDAQVHAGGIISGKPVGSSEDFDQWMGGGIDLEGHHFVMEPQNLPSTIPAPAIEEDNGGDDLPTDEEIDRLTGRKSGIDLKKSPVAMSTPPVQASIPKTLIVFQAHQPGEMVWRKKSPRARKKIWQRMARRKLPANMRGVRGTTPYKGVPADDSMFRLDPRKEGDQQRRVA